MFQMLHLYAAKVSVPTPHLILSVSSPLFENLDMVCVICFFFIDERISKEKKQFFFNGLIILSFRFVSNIHFLRRECLD